MTQNAMLEAIKNPTYNVPYSYHRRYVNAFVQRLECVVEDLPTQLQSLVLGVMERNNVTLPDVDIPDLKAYRYACIKSWKDVYSRFVEALSLYYNIDLEEGN